MPALVLFKRRWYVNGDDVFLPGFIEIFIRSVWLMAIAIVFHTQKDEFEPCHLTWEYYVGNLVFIPIGICLSMLVVHSSMRGSIMDMATRKHLPFFIYIKMIFALPEVIWNILGTVWAYGNVSECSSQVRTVMKVYVIGGWIFFAIITTVIAFFFGCLQKRNVDRESYVKVWEDRCNKLFCCKTKKMQNKNALHDVAKMVAPFFENSNLVPTDIFAGLLLVQEKQEQEDAARLKAKRLKAAAINAGVTPHMMVTSLEPTENGTSSKVIDLDGDEKGTFPTKTVPPPIVVLQDWMHLESIKYYLRFAMAMYGWPMHMFMNIGCGACQLAPYCRCCSFSRVPKGDNCCQCNMATFYKLTEHFDVKILYVSFQNEIFQSPFIVSVDQKNSAVVVSIRGSLSLEDAITDMSAETEIAQTANLEFQCHRGILRTAYYVKKVLEEHSLLEKGFQDTGNERIVVTGHSLGAGVAAILSILLKDKYEDVRCFSYAPPGGLLGRLSSDYSKNFIISSFYGDDIIPRLSLCNIEKLKNHIVDSVNACPLPKHKILMNSLFCGSELSKFVEEMKGSFEDPEKDSLHQEQLYPPGVVLYINDNVEDEKCGVFCSCSPQTCSMEWFTPDQFQEIRISSTMVTDHFPDALSDALDRLVVTPIDV